MSDSSRVKRELIASLDERRAAARAFISTLPPELPVHDDSDWTARDLITHLTALEADMITALHCAMTGAAFAVDLRGQPDVQALYELRRCDCANLSWDELLGEWERVRDQLRGVVLAFPIDMMQTRFPTPFFEDYDLIEALGACGAHERLHLTEMHAAAGGHLTTEDTEDFEGAD
jgi:hypothetical protein